MKNLTAIGGGDSSFHGYGRTASGEAGVFMGRIRAVLNRVFSSPDAGRWWGGWGLVRGRGWVAVDRGRRTWRDRCATENYPPAHR